MRYEAIDRQSLQHRINWMCDLLDVCRSSIYDGRCRRQRRVEIEQAESHFLLHVKAAHEASRGVYGSPQIHQALLTQGIVNGRRRVERLMREACLSGRSRRKFLKTTRVDETIRPAENKLARNFRASEPNKKWVTDITYLATKEGFLSSIRKCNASTFR